MSLSYLAVLKNSLFSSNQQVSTNDKISSENSKELKEDWIYIHDEDNSQTEETVDLDNSEFSFTNKLNRNNLCDDDMITTSNDKNNIVIDEELLKKQQEIIINRNLWLAKNNKKLLKLNKNNSSNKIRSKIMKRKRNMNSTSSVQSTENCTLNSLSNLFNENNYNQETNNKNQQIVKRITTESVDDSNTKSCMINGNETNGKVSPSPNYNLRSKINKRPKLQNRCKPCNSRVINQPMAKGL